MVLPLTTQGIRHPISSQPIPACQIITKVALTCLKEFALTVAIGLGVACFVPTAVGMGWMISAAFVQLAANGFFHSLGTYSSMKVEQGDLSYGRIAALCQWITGANFAVLTGYNTQTLIHESGHAMAALACYAKPRPNIQVHPFVGGITQFFKTSLSPFGKKLGPVTTTCFIIASGPGFALLISSILFSIGLAIREKYPHVGKYLIAWGLLDFLHHAEYAYSALGADPSNFSHDFVHLSVFGLNPAVAAVGIIAIPILLHLAVNWVEKRQLLCSWRKNGERNIRNQIAF